MIKKPSILQQTLGKALKKIARRTTGAKLLQVIASYCKSLQVIASYYNSLQVTTSYNKLLPFFQVFDELINQPCDL